MFAKRTLMLSSASALLGLLLAACSAAAAKAPPTPTPEQSPLETPTLSLTLAATATETPTSTPTPIATVTPRPVTLLRIRIIYPAPGTQITAGQQIAIQSAAVAGAGVARIELRVDGALYATTLNSRPGSIAMAASQVWSSSVPGDHTLTVLAYDNLGRVSVPASAIVTVVSSPAAPMVWISQPYAPSGRIVVQSGDSVLFEYWATDAAGVTRMELWADGQLYATDTNPGQTTVMHVQNTWSSTTLGDHTLFVRAYDTLQQYSDSASFDVGVADRNPPSVKITSPADGTQFQAGQTVPVAVSANDSKGITHVELWVDNLLYATWNSASPVGESATQLSLAWQHPTQGSHTLYVIADDSVGLSTQTPSITVSIVAPPQPTPTTMPGPRLVVNPATSPTDLLYQTITGQTDPNVNITIVGEAGRFYERSNADGSFAVTINLAPDSVNHIIVTAAFDNPSAAVTETQTDANGNPLDIVQVPAPTPVLPTPTPTPTPVPPTSTPMFTPVPPTRTPTPTSTRVRPAPRPRR